MLDGIAHLGKLRPKGSVGKGSRDGGVDILTDQPPHRGFAILFGVPFCIGRALPLWLYDRKAVGAAYLIGDSTDIPVVVLKGIAELAAVHKTHGVKQDVTMEVVMV